MNVDRNVDGNVTEGIVAEIFKVVVEVGVFGYD